MSIAHLLEDFTIQSGTGALHLLDDDALAEQRAKAFEEGYGAGWEDAVQTQDQAESKLSSDLTGALTDMSFTYHEALTRMTTSLEPMFQGLIGTVLPEMLEQSFGQRIVTELCDMARDQVRQPIILRVPEGVGKQVAPLVPQEMSPAVKITEDPSLQSGQARMQVGTASREVDCEALLGNIASAFEAYFFEANEALSNE